MRRPKKKWRRNPVAVVPLGMVVLGVVGVVGLRMAAARGLEREMEAIRARGLPTNPEELNEWYAAVPEEENLALKILEAAEGYVEPALGRDPLKYSLKDTPNGEPLRTEIAEAAAEFTAKNHLLLARVHRAAGLKRSRFPVDFSKPDNSDRLLGRGPLSDVKRLMHLSKWEAILRAERGDAEGAAQALLSGFAVSSSLTEKPASISQLVRMSCLVVELEALEWSVNRVRFSDAALEELGRAAQRAEGDGRGGMQRAMGGEIAGARGGKFIREMPYHYFSTAMRWSVSEDLPGFFVEWIYKGRQWTAMHDADAAFYLRSLLELERAWRLEHPEMLRATKAVHSRIAKEVRANPIKYLGSEMMLSPLEKIAEKAAVVASRLKCVQAGLAIERFRLRNEDRLPKIEELVPEFLKEWPTDAVNGQPLKYEVGGSNQFRVVAVAAWELANEGRAETSTNWQDVAFTVVK